ncbi:MAG: VIT1/CCC1 transporter family protein [Chloroflexota bacterium]|nr:VIT1/CCC1 transporter family protein [Chloroflexota bacterium]
MSLTKRLDAARDAFVNGDTRRCEDLHSPASVAQIAVSSANREGESLLGRYLGDFVYGGLDGIITTFAVVSGVAGAQLGAPIILILGIANLLADGFSMGTGAYLSSKSEREFYDREKQRELWEIEQVPDGQRNELRTLYVTKGYTPEEADQLVAIQSQHRERWAETMLVEQAGLLKDETNPFKSAVATFAAFLIAGALPLIIYLVGLVVPVADNTAFLISMILSGVALFTLGAAKVVVTKLNPVRSGMEMLIIGGFAALVAYVVGALLKNIGG